MKRALLLIMSLAISITTRDGASVPLAQIAEDIQPSAELHQYIADEARFSVQTTFLAMAGSEQNALKHTGFWNRMLSGLVSVASDDAATVRMPREVAQRYFGGTITPVKGKFLAIPLRSEAVGVSPRQFNDLRFIPTARGGVLVQREQTQISTFKKGKRKGQVLDAKETGGGAFYALVRSVTQRPNADVLPSDEELGAASVRGVRSFLNRRNQA